MLFIGLTPIESNRVFSHSGDSSTLTPEIVSPEYLGQASLSSTIISIILFSLSALKFSTEGQLNFDEEFELI